MELGAGDHGFALARLQKPFRGPVRRGGGSTFWGTRNRSPLVLAQGGQGLLQGAEAEERGWVRGSPSGAPPSYLPPSSLSLSPLPLFPLPPSLPLFPFLLPVVRLNWSLPSTQASAYLSCRPLEGSPRSHAPSQDIPVRSSWTPPRPTIPHGDLPFCHTRLVPPLVGGLAS